MRARNHAQAPQGATGTCRDRRRPESLRRKAWARPIRRLHRALDSSVHLISRSLLSAGASERRAQRRPIRSSRELEKIEELILLASSRLSQAARELAKVHACIARDPENAGDAPELLILATERWIFMAGWLAESAGSVFDRHEDVLDGIRNGTLVPERSAFPRPRIILAPRPVPIRAFLLILFVWKLGTEFIWYPLTGKPAWEFVERWANYTAPLALLVVRGWPSSVRDWLR